MKKRTLAVILIIIVVLAGLWLTRQQTVSPEYTSPAQSAETQDALVSLDEAQPADTAEPEQQPQAIAEDGSYTSKEDVSLYLYTYGRLPDNFMTKDEARALGWEGGGLDDYAYGKCIGGDRFGNYEGLLPEQAGRTYFECDVDTLHAGSRGAERIVFSSDGLIYYTGDHYESFELLYGNP